MLILGLWLSDALLMVLLTMLTAMLTLSTLFDFKCEPLWMLDVMHMLGAMSMPMQVVVMLDCSPC